MEAFYICWTALLKESEKHQVFIWNAARKGFGTRLNHSILLDRLKYIYLRGPMIIHSLQNCVLRSISNQTLPLYYKLAKTDNCNVCCLSNGPGLEILGFLLGFKEHIHAFKSVSATVINPLKEWHDFSEALMCENLYYRANSFDFISCDPGNLNSPACQSIQKADVIIMHNCFPAREIQSYTLMMKEITTLMKEGALLFFINSKAKNKIIGGLKVIGTSLCSTKKLIFENMPYDTRLSSMVGIPPVTKGKSRLIVWEKGISVKASSTGMDFKNELRPEHFSSLQYGSENSVTSMGSFICLPKQKLVVTPSNLPNSNKLFPRPKNNSEIDDNVFRENNSSYFKEDISSSMSEVSSEATAVKFLDSNVWTEQFSSLQYGSENSVISDHFSMGSLICLPEQKLADTSSNLPDSNKLFPRPKNNSEIHDNVVRENNSSDFKEDISCSMSEVSAETTVVKSLDSNVWTEQFSSLQYSSENSVISDHFSMGSLICLSEQKLADTSSNLPDSNKLFPQPKNNSEIHDNVVRENNSSDFKEDISCSMSEVSAETTVVKSLDSNVWTEQFSSLQYSSENSVISDHFSMGSLICLSEQKLDDTSSNLPDSNKLFPQPKNNSEIHDNVVRENNSSDFKEDISSSMSEVSSETTAVKSLESSVLSKSEDFKCQVSFSNVPKSDKECEVNLKYDLPESERSEINSMLEHCERLIDNLEMRIRDCAMQQHSYKNFCNNCCNRNHICCNLCLASHQKCAHYNVLNQNCCHNYNYN